MIKYEMCKGPKKSNLTSLSSSMTLDEKGEWIFSFNMTILEEIMVDQVQLATLAFHLVILYFWLLFAITFF